MDSTYYIKETPYGFDVRSVAPGQAIGGEYDHSWRWAKTREEAEQIKADAEAAEARATAEAEAFWAAVDRGEGAGQDR